MSKNYCIETDSNSERKTTEQMRLFCQRPGKMDENGKPIYFTEQAHKKICDVNNIIKKYDKTGVIQHVTKFEAKFGDVTGIEFRAMHDKIISAQQSFDSLPSSIRKRFGNDAGRLIAFMDNPDNREEAIKLGLISSDTPPEIDGLGEHVVNGVAQPDPAGTETSPEE